MKVAVSALGPNLDDQVDERFGRATYLLIVDVETYEFEAVSNAKNRDALQGAGLGAAETVSESGAEAVITGHLGPKAFNALSLIDIKGFNGTGMLVREAVDAYKNGSLEPLSPIEAHRGLE